MPECPGRVNPQHGMQEVSGSIPLGSTIFNDLASQSNKIASEIRRTIVGRYFALIQAFRQFRATALLLAKQAFQNP